MGHVPILATEIKRLFAAIVVYREAQSEAQAMFLRRVIRGGEDVERVMNDTMAILDQAYKLTDSEMAQRLMNWHHQELADLTQQKMALESA